MNELAPKQSGGEFLLYQTEDGRVRLDVRLQDETVWLTQATMSELFQTTPQNITTHLKAIYKEGEVGESATCKEYLQVQQEGSRRVSRTLLKAADLPAPRFEFGDFYTVIFYRKQYMPQGEEKSSGKTADRIIKLIGENSLITIPELAETLEITTRTIEKQISKLQKNGQLKHIGPAKGGYWQVIYSE